MCACLFVLIVFFFCVCMYVIRVDIQQYTTTDGLSRSVNTHVQILNQSSRFSLHSQKLLARVAGLLWPTRTRTDNLTKLWHAWISRVYVCICDFVWFRWLLFSLLTGMLCILRQNENKRVAQNCVLVAAKWKENTARFILCICECVRGWVLWKSSNENNYDSMRICCLSNRRVKNVFCVIFVNLTFDSFWFTLFFQRQKIGSVCGCVSSFTSAILFHHFLFFSLFLFTLLSRFNISVFFGTW